MAIKERGKVVYYFECDWCKKKYDFPGEGGKTQNVARPEVVGVEFSAATMEGDNRFDFYNAVNFTVCCECDDAILGLIEERKRLRKKR